MQARARARASRETENRRHIEIAGSQSARGFGRIQLNIDGLMNVREFRYRSLTCMHYYTVHIRGGAPRCVRQRILVTKHKHTHTHTRARKNERRLRRWCRGYRKFCETLRKSDQSLSRRRKVDHGNIDVLGYFLLA